jgi:hypothetical protein
MVFSGKVEIKLSSVFVLFNVFIITVVFMHCVGGSKILEQWIACSHGSFIIVGSLTNIVFALGLVAEYETHS